MAVTDFKALQKWAKIPKNIQQLIISNAFCPKCGVTTIVEYTLNDDKHGILLKGICKKCGNEVRRLVEDE
jgi:ribosomal protein S27AE